MTNSIAFLTLDWSYGTEPLEPNGCAWYRCMLPMHELNNLGWEAQIGPPEYSLEHGFGIFHSKEEVIYGWDIVVFKLIMLKSVAEIMQNNKPKNQKIVIDIDDFYEGLSPTNHAYKVTDPETNPEVNREHYWTMIENADAIITSTPFLHDYYKNEKGLKNVFMVRNAIDIDRWKPRQDHARWLPTVGWVGAIPWRSNDLETLQPWFGSFLEENHLSFHHSGHIPEIKNVNAFKQLGIPESVKFTNQKRMPISKYPEMFRKIDIGIVPLNDIPFNHAKSTIKGLEYVAAGIPYIASYSPEYEFFANQGIGRMAKNEQEWIGHLEELQNPKTRKEDIERNYENVKQLHTIKARGEEWNDVFKKILDL
jgi:glycosyltransferase involved in cell wall biosynthesis